MINFCKNYNMEMTKKDDKLIPVLTIAGSDPSGGAGIQADLKTMLAHGVYGMAAITALTAQNTTGVYGIFPVTGEFLEKQMDSVFSDIFPEAVKIGMLGNEELAVTVARVLKKYNPRHIVVDPVMVSTSGAKLLDCESIELFKKELFSLAEVLTPNVPELEALTGIKIKSEIDFKNAAKELSEQCGCAVLAKGGHIIEGIPGKDPEEGGKKDLGKSSVNEKCSSDLLCQKGEFQWFYGERIDNPNIHGSGCTLSSAIASNLAKGLGLTESIRLAKEYINTVISAMLNLGKGHGPMNHGAAGIIK